MLRSCWYVQCSRGLCLAEEEKFRATATVSALNTASRGRAQRGQPRARGGGGRGGGHAEHSTRLV